MAKKLRVRSFALVALCLLGLMGSGCKKDGDKEVDNEKLEKFLANRPGLRPNVAQEPFIPPRTIEPYRIDSHTGGSLEPHRELEDLSGGAAGAGNVSEPSSEDTDSDLSSGSSDDFSILNNLQSQFTASIGEDSSSNREELGPGLEGLELTASGQQAPEIVNQSANPTYQIDFAQNFSKSASEILDEMGFEVPSIFIKDIAPRFQSASLIVGNSNRGFYGLRKKEITEISEEQKQALGKMTLTWGVSSYPPGENWSQKNRRRNSVGLIVSFGKKTNAGVPYFLGFVLTKTGKPFEYHRPTRYGDVGRYVTLANPPINTMMQTNVDLRKHFKAAFGTGIPYPGVSGIAIEVDTRDMSGVGFIQKIQFFE